MPRERRRDSGRIAAGCLLLLGVVAAVGAATGSLRPIRREIRLDDPATVLGLSIAGGLLVACAAVGLSVRRGPRARRLSGLLFSAAALGGGLWFAVRAGARIAAGATARLGPGEVVSTVLDGALGALLLGLGSLVLWATRTADSAERAEEE